MGATRAEFANPWPASDAIRAISPVIPSMPRDSEWSPAVYRELRRLAEGMLSGERSGHTLAPTALAHEVWIRLSASRNASELGPRELVGLAAQTMRRILVEHARARNAQKRGGDLRRTTLDGKALESEPADFVLDLEDALTALAGHDPELARVVELRFHGGLSVEEAAQALGSSARTVKRRWRFARAWLQQRIGEMTP
jgi:RNA polymerase sigma factor (TIGR02999 family)